MWGSGYGDTRQAAIKDAALDQPSTGFIKRAIGWVARHPFIAGAAVGMYLAYRRAKNHHQEIRLVDYLSAGVVAGTITWAFSKVFKFSGLVPEDDGKAYGSAPGGYWASNLPYAYVDTQAGDPSEEKAVTIGSAYGVGINAETVYYTVTRMYEGGGTSSWIKLSSQRGRRDPQWCLSPYCSYGCDATSNIVTIHFQSHFSVPGCYQYWYEWDATGEHPCN